MRSISLTFCLSLLFASSPTLQAQSSKAAPKLTESALGDTVNVHQCGTIYLAGQPTQQDVETIQQKGIKRVISLRTEGEVNWDSGAVWQASGLAYSRIAFRQPDTLTDEVFDKVRKLLKESDRKPVLVHCGSATRVSAVWFAFRVLDQGVSMQQAKAEARRVSPRFGAYEKAAESYIQRQQSK